MGFEVWDLRFGVWGLGFGVWGLWFCLVLGAWELESVVQGPGCLSRTDLIEVVAHPEPGAGFKVQRSGLRVQGLKFRVRVQGPGTRVDD